MDSNADLWKHIAQTRPDKSRHGLELSLSSQVIPQPGRCLSLAGFDDPCMALIIKDYRRLFPSKKRNCLPITKDILEKITEDELLSVVDLNSNMIFKMAWAGFVRMGKLTYIATEAKKATFVKIGLIRSDILFAEGD